MFHSTQNHFLSSSVVVTSETVRLVDEEEVAEVNVLDSRSVLNHESAGESHLNNCGNEDDDKEGRPKGVHCDAVGHFIAALRT